MLLLLLAQHLSRMLFNSQEPPRLLGARSESRPPHPQTCLEALSQWAWQLTATRSVSQAGLSLPAASPCSEAQGR